MKLKKAFRRVAWDIQISDRNSIQTHNIHMALKRYWFTLERLDDPHPLNLGWGVTAYNYTDATALLHERVFTGRDLPAIVGCIEDVDVSTLDQKHVVPNIGSVSIRGIWFPQGYNECI